MFEVDVARLVSTPHSFDDRAAELYGLESRLRKSVSSGILITSSYSRTLGSLYSLSRGYSSDVKGLRSLAEAMRGISKAYADTEGGIVGVGRQFLGSENKNHIASPISNQGNQGSVNKKARTYSDDKVAIERGKAAVKGLDEIKEFERLPGAYLSIFNYFSCLTDLFDSNSEVGFWSGLSKFWKNSAGLLKQVYSLTDWKAGKNVTSIGSGMLGVVSALNEVSEGNYSGNVDLITTWYDKVIGSVVDLGNSAYKTGHEDSIKLRSVIGLIKGGLGILNQSAKSWDHYVMSDGNLTFDEFLLFMAETSSAGLEGGIDGVTGGIVNKKTIGLTPEEFVQGSIDSGSALVKWCRQMLRNR